MNAAQEMIRDQITRWISPLGYEIVDVEFVAGKRKILRVYIDFLGENPSKKISVEDCAVVSRAIDEPLDQLPEIDELFRGAYELEVSSPGICRPLRAAKDFERFRGSEIRVHTFRPLTAEELENGVYQAKNPRQKTFFGVLRGLKDNKIFLDVDPAGSAEGKKTAKGKSKTNQQPAYQPICIPLALMTKANLEPQWDEELLNSGRAS